MAAVWKGFAQAHQPVRLPKRQRLKDHSVDHGENSRIGSDPQRECGDGNCGKSRITAHGADRITDVGCKCRHASIYAGRSGKFAEILYWVPVFPPPCQHRNAPDQLRYPPRAALVSLPPQREPRCEAVRSPLSPRSQVLTFLRSLASSEANPEKWFSACFSAPPRLRVKQHLSNSTQSRPGRNRRRPVMSGRLRTAVPRRIGKACSANRRERNFRAIIRAMRVCPPEYQHLHSRSPKHFRAILINTRKAIALPNPRV